MGILGFCSWYLTILKQVPTIDCSYNGLWIKVSSQGKCSMVIEEVSKLTPFLALEYMTLHSIGGWVGRVVVSTRCATCLLGLGVGFCCKGNLKHRGGWLGSTLDGNCSCFCSWKWVCMGNFPRKG